MTKIVYGLVALLVLAIGFLVVRGEARKRAEVGETQSVVTRANIRRPATAIPARKQAPPEAEAAVRGLEALGSVVHSGVTLASYRDRIMETRIAVDQFARVIGQDHQAVAPARRAMEHYEAARDLWNACIFNDACMDHKLLRLVNRTEESSLILARYPEVWTVAIDDGAYVAIDAALTVIWKMADRETTAARAEVDRL